MGPAERLLEVFSVTPGAGTRADSRLQHAGDRFPVDMKKFVMHKLGDPEWPTSSPGDCRVSRGVTLEKSQGWPLRPYNLSF